MQQVPTRAGGAVLAYDLIHLVTITLRRLHVFVAIERAATRSVHISDGQTADQ